MEDRMNDAATTGPEMGLHLDPFEYHGYTASCIAGLGGDQPDLNPTYAFHTSYVPVARGHAHFNVRFRNLRARFGTLWLRVHMLPSESGATAHMVTSHRIQLNRLVHHGGETYIKFEAYHGATYALMGVILDRTDAAADELDVYLDRPFGLFEDEDLLSINETTSTNYGTQALKPASQLISLEPSTLALPVSQPFTSTQLAEPVFKLWSVPPIAGAPEAAWERAYLLQALEFYGMMQEGVNGAIFGSIPDGVAQTLQERGVTYENVILAGDGIRTSEVISEARHIDAYNLRKELSALDFLCTIRVTDLFEDERLAAAFLERSMECLRPGGLAVHIVAASACYGRTRDESTSIHFDRNAIERIALSLMSRGHDMARVKPLTQRSNSGGESHRPIPFGLIARRARSIL